MLDQPAAYENLLKEVRSEPERVLSVKLSWLVATYLNHLEGFLEEGFEKAGEYLRLNSYLIYLKSRALLPSEPKEKEREELLEETPSFPSPLEPLRRVLEERPLLGREIFVSPGEELPAPELEASLETLVKSLLDLLERHPPPPVEVRRLEPLFRKMRTWLVQELEEKKRLYFEELVSQMEEPLERVALFLALLDLSFRQFCRLIQTGPWKEIEILLREE